VPPKRALGAHPKRKKRKKKEKIKGGANTHFYPLSVFFRNSVETESEANPDPQEYLGANSWVGLQK